VCQKSIINFCCGRSSFVPMTRVSLSAERNHLRTVSSNSTHEISRTFVAVFFWCHPLIKGRSLPNVTVASDWRLHNFPTGIARRGDLSNCAYGERMHNSFWAMRRK
jgi:hypothetical protein